MSGPIGQGAGVPQVWQKVGWQKRHVASIRPATTGGTGGLGVAFARLVAFEFEGAFKRPVKFLKCKG